jgi:MerR family transcriptional regulator/heat shock protein HspR
VQESDRAMFAISVAAKLSGTTVQNLRAYERGGLLEPKRTQGGTRRYSEVDVERLMRIRALLDAGLNIAGIEQVLALEQQVHDLQVELDQRAARAER